MYLSNLARPAAPGHRGARPAKQFSAQYESHRADEYQHFAPQGYQLIDPAKGTAAPIEVTMRRVAEDYQKRQSPK